MWWLVAAVAMQCHDDNGDALMRFNQLPAKRPPDVREKHNVNRQIALLATTTLSVITLFNNINTIILQ